MRTLLSLIVFISALPALHALDWPQFRGPNRDGVSPDQGLAAGWPEGGPELLWTAKGVGGGYSSVATADGVLYTLGDEQDACYLYALSAAGKHL